MSSSFTTGQSTLLYGNFRRGYAIVDHVSSTMIEVVDNVVDSSGLPTGQRGYLLWWRTTAGYIDGGESMRVLKL